jgi:hypothetical protein
MSTFIRVDLPAPFSPSSACVSGVDHEVDVDQNLILAKRFFDAVHRYGDARRVRRGTRQLRLLALFGPGKLTLAGP